MRGKTMVYCFDFCIVVYGWEWDLNAWNRDGVLLVKPKLLERPSDNYSGFQLTGDTVVGKLGVTILHCWWILLILVFRLKSILTRSCFWAFVVEFSRWWFSRLGKMCLWWRDRFFWDFWTMVANNGAMVDNVDDVENWRCFGRLATMATVSRESGERPSLKNELCLCWWGRQWWQRWCWQWWWLMMMLTVDDDDEGDVDDDDDKERKRWRV